IPVDGHQQLIEKICTRPFAVDWDGDGHLDLVVGNFSGTFYWFKGQGKGKFLPKPEQIMAGGAPLKLPGAHSDPFVIDLDGDGALDLVSGCSDGGVYWARNKAGKGKMPDLEPFRPRTRIIPLFTFSITVPPGVICYQSASRDSRSNSRIGRRRFGSGVRFDKME